jgi:transcriptional regulator with XRE-family HTH domain
VRSLHHAGYRSLVDALIAARSKAALTQQEVADRLGKPQSFVAKTERGERRLDLVEFVAYARALGLSPDNFLRKLLPVLDEKD